MSRWLAYIPVAALAGVVVTGGSLLLKGGDPHVSPDALVGKPLPASVVRELDNGAGMRLTTAVKGPALVNVFASWCAPCKAEQPLLMKLKADGVPIVGVAWKDKALDTKSFLAEQGDPFTAVVRDPGGQAGIDLGITGVPETFLVDRHGVVVEKRGMPLTEQDAAALEAKWRTLNGG